jgi:hypothetical protein
LRWVKGKKGKEMVEVGWEQGERVKEKKGKERVEVQWNEERGGRGRRGGRRTSECTAMSNY